MVNGPQRGDRSVGRNPSALAGMTGSRSSPWSKTLPDSAPSVEAALDGFRSQRALLIGTWEAFPAGQSVLRTQSGVVIERCRATSGPLRELVMARRPAWLLVGQGLTDEAGSRLLEVGRSVQPGLLVGLLGAPDDLGSYHRWMRRGIVLYLVNSADAERVGFALRTVVGQGVVIIDRAFCPQPAYSPCTNQRPRITRRENEVLELVVLGMRNREIASSLHLSENTVEAHLRNLFSKLEVRTRVEAVRKATRDGFT